MSLLVARVEQAYVGAMLDEEFPWDLEWGAVHRIGPAHLTDSVRRHVLASVVALNESDRPWRAGQTVVDAVAEDTAGRGVTRGDVLRLSWSCPNPAHVADYARLLAGAHLRRHIAAHAQHAAEQAAVYDDVHHEQLNELAGALARSAHLHDDLRPAPDGADVPGPTPSPPRNRDPDPRTAREENVLAALLLGDPASRIIPAFLPPESFRDAGRREIYEATIALARRGSAVDSVLVAWELAERRAVTGDPDAAGLAVDRDGVRLDALGSGRDAAAVMAYLDGMPRPGSVTLLDDARQMLTDDIDAGHYRRPVPVLGSGHVLSASGPAPEPGATPSPAITPGTALDASVGTAQPVPDRGLMPQPGAAPAEQARRPPALRP